MNVDLTATDLHHVEHVMGTVVSFDIRRPVPTVEALEQAVGWLHEVDATFSTYREDSEITRFGRGQIGIDELSRDVEDVLLRCIELTEQTGGAFDAFAVPAPNGTSLDPSGLVKGWSIEHAAHILEERGATNFCINAGGDIVVRGQAATGTAWRVGVRHPEFADRFAVILDVTGPLGIATSATYERGAHIIDPRLGTPTTELASATVVGPDLATADAYATAAFVMGLDSIEWIQTQPGYHVYLITHDDATCWSPDFPHPGHMSATRSPSSLC